MMASRRIVLASCGILLLLAAPLLADVEEERVPPVRPPAVPGRAPTGDPTDGDALPSPILFPGGAGPLDFDHRIHGEVACAECHAGAAESRRAADSLLPDEAACARCHAVAAAPDADATAVCGRCHPTYRPPGEPPRFSSTAATRDARSVRNPPPGVARPSPYVRFDHAAHATAGIDCVVCHARATAQDRSPAGASLPLMGDCLGCHDGRRADDSCRTCHLTDAAGRVRWRLPTGLLVPTGRSFGDRHDEAFVREHGPAAARDRRHCASCHADDGCQACHDGVARPAAVHPPGWRALHAVPARKDPRGCAACHRASGDCIACHRRSHVVAEGEQRFPPDEAFHPAGWTDAPGALPGPRHHGHEARRNLRACVSCHREETCLACHRTPAAATGAAGGSRGVFANPHGRSFRDRCTAMRERNEAVCLRCHARGDASLGLCR